jgi:crossover junction endodeoxyribonuclease RusA
MDRSEMIEIEFPWPDFILSPNNRAHWAQKAKAKAIQREQSRLLALDKRPDVQGDIHITMVFCPPSSRNYDIDNLLASCKAMLDGVADAWEINDKNFTPITIMFGDKKKNGAVILKI